MTDEEKELIAILEEKDIIATSDKNLRSKIDSIVRALENLSAKRARIDYEIRKQKRTLIRKREELRRVSKSNHQKVSLTLESLKIPEDEKQVDLLELTRLDSRLLQESSRVLDS